MQAPVHATRHHGRRVRPPHANSTTLAQLLIDKGILVRHEVLESRRAGSTGHALVLERVLGRVGDAVERSQELALAPSDIARCCLVEDVRVQDGDGVETGSPAVVGEDSEEIFGQELDGGD